MARTRIRHTIELHYTEGEYVTIDFDSHDIGCTQGTTLTLQGHAIARYRPGTRYWDRALETAEQLVAAAADQVIDRGRFELSAFVTALLAAIAADPHCTLWDGTVPDRWAAE